MVEALGSAGKMAGATVASPCTKVCEIGAHGLCVGCFRTPEEIGLWPQLQPVDQRRLLDRLALRAEALRSAPAGGVGQP